MKFQIEYYKLELKYKDATISNLNSNLMDYRELIKRKNNDDDVLDRKKAEFSEIRNENLKLKRMIEELNLKTKKLNENMKTLENMLRHAKVFDKDNYLIPSLMANEYKEQQNMVNENQAVQNNEYFINFEVHQCASDVVRDFGNLRRSLDHVYEEIDDIIRI